MFLFLFALTNDVDIIGLFCLIELTVVGSLDIPKSLEEGVETVALLPLDTVSVREVVTLVVNGELDFSLSHC